MTLVREAFSNLGSVLHLEGDLRAPLNDVLRHQVQALLDRGERSIVLNLARVSDLDAAGIGELARVYNVTLAGDGRLRIVNATTRVRRILERVGLFDVLS